MTVDPSREQHYAHSRDYLRAGVNVLLREGACFPKGAEIRITSNIPMQASVSSSSALVIIWLRLLWLVSGTSAPAGIRNAGALGTPHRGAGVSRTGWHDGPLLRCAGWRAVHRYHSALSCRAAPRTAERPGVGGLLILPVLRNLPFSTCGEYELTDAMQILLQRYPDTVRAVRFEGHWSDVGTPERLWQVERHLAQDYHRTGANPSPKLLEGGEP